MPTSENDVLDLMNRAAMDAPSMSLAPQAVLASAQQRRRRQRQTRGGMALAAFAAAGVIWLGTGSGLGDGLGNQVDPAMPSDVEAPQPTEWDGSVSFEAPLPAGTGFYEGFADASLVRVPGENFAVQSIERADVRVTPVEGDLPEGVALFVNDGSTLVVSEPRFEGQPVLGFGPGESESDSAGLPITDGDRQAFVWLMDGEISAADLHDVYWLLPDQVVASTGAPVINEVVAVGDDEVSIIILPETGQWAQRSAGGIEGLVVVQDSGDFGYALEQGNLNVVVLPSEVKNPTFTPSREAGAAGEGASSLPMSTREVGDYVIAWASSTAPVDPLSPGLVRWDSPEPTEPVEIPKVIATVEGDRTTVIVEGTESELLVHTGQTSGRAVFGADGSALAIAAWPEGISSVDGPVGPHAAAPQAVFRAYSTIVTGQEFLKNAAPGVYVLPGGSGLVAVGQPAMPEPYEADSNIEIIPTLLFEGEAGPQWAGGRRPIVVGVDGTELRVAVEPDLDLWVVSCAVPGTTIGDVGSPGLQFVECPDRNGSGAGTVYGGTVLPTNVAQITQLLPTPERRNALEPLPEPTVADLGGGLSFWVVPLGTFEQGLMGGLLDGTLLQGIEGLDVDGDGVLDRPTALTYQP